MINHIWIIKDSGQNLFYKNYGSAMHLDENLISGLFIALNSFAKESGKGEIDSLILKDAKFIYMNFETIFVVVGCDRKDEIAMMKEKMNSIGNLFIENYGTLEKWDGNNKMFSSFSKILEAEFKSKPKTYITPMHMTKEERIIKEYDDVISEFACEIVKDSKANINVFLSRSLEDHYVININFSEYPEKPDVKFPKGLKKLLGKPEEALLILDNWNPENPAKIVEILRELEYYLIKTTQIEAFSSRLMVDDQQDKK